MWREKVPVYSRKLVCKYNILFDWCTNKLLFVDTGFYCVKSSFLVEKVTF